MSKLLANQIANYGDDAPIEIKEGLNIPAGKPIQAAGSAGTSGQVLSSTGTSIAWSTPFNGDYNSLTNKPTIPAAQVNADWNSTGGVSLILNKPVVPPQSSVTTAAAGTAALSYNSTNGEFTFTPPDLSGYATEAWVGSQGYLTSYTETDTLDSVCERGKQGLSGGGFASLTDVRIVGTDGIKASYFGCGALGGAGQGDLQITHNDNSHDSFISHGNSLGDLAISSVTRIDLVADSGSGNITVDGNLIVTGPTNLGTQDLTTTGKLYYSNNFATTGDLPNATTYHGMFAHVHAEGHGYFAHAGAWTQLLDTGSSISELADVNLAVAPQSGQVLAYDGSNWVATAAGGGGGGIALTDLSVTTATAGTAALTYNNVSGVFTYTPPDVSGFLTTETDPVFTASAASGITSTNITNWNLAYGWGNHAGAGYLTSYTETDTLDSVTGRGATTTNALTVGGVSIGDDDGTKAKSLKLGDDDDLVLFYDGRVGYVTSYIESDQMIIRPKTTPSDTYIDMIEGGPVRLYHGSSTRISTSATGAVVSGILTAGGLTYPNTNGTSGDVLTSDGAGNVTWAAPTGGSGGANVTVSDTIPAGTPTAGDLWWESDTGRLKIYYQDTDSSQWVDTNPPLTNSNVPLYVGELELYNFGTQVQWTGNNGVTVSLRTAEGGGGFQSDYIRVTFPTAFSSVSDYTVQATVYDAGVVGHIYGHAIRRTNPQYFDILIYNLTSSANATQASVAVAVYAI